MCGADVGSFMTKKKKSTKQLIEERNEARKEKLQELRNEYKPYKRERNKLNKWWFGVSGESGFFSIQTQDQFINNGLSKWEFAQPVIVSGSYQDYKKSQAIFQQKFMDFKRQCCPWIIDELKETIPYFDKLFGNDKAGFHRIFEHMERANLIDSDQHLDTYVHNQLPDYRLLEFRPWFTRSFRDDYIWGEFRILLQFLYLTLASVPASKLDVIRSSTVALLQQSLEFRPNVLSQLTGQDDAMRSYISTTSELVLRKFLADIKSAYFVDSAKRILARLLDDNPESNSEVRVEAFIVLQTELLMWAERNKLEKAWLLRYAYYFLSKYSENPGCRDSETETGVLLGRELYTDKFDFEFGGWVPGDETKEKYERRLRAHFEIDLENHFQFWGRHLKLDKGRLYSKKGVTKPKDPDFDSVKWLLAWNEGATYPQIARCFGRSQTTIKSAMKVLASYDLPVRVGKPGRMKNPIISDDRLEKIKSIK
jgi:hypothetical protein